mgnify:CR=1 FL=1
MNMKKLRLIIYFMIAMLVGVFLGIAWISIGNEGLDGEYFRALKTVGGSGINWIDAIFRYGVVLLVNLAKILGISYEELNIWVFIIIHPLITLILFIWALILCRKIKQLKLQHHS